MFDDIVSNDDGVDGSEKSEIDYKEEYWNVEKQIAKLADFIMAEFQNQIGKGGSLGAVDEAIRLLKEYKNMLEQWNGKNA